MPFDVGIQYLTRDLSAIALGDYTPQSPTPLTLKAGQTTAKIIVRVTGDTVEEGDEIFRVQLARPLRVLIGRSEAFGTVLDDDHKGVVSIGDARIEEGNSGSRDLTFQVTLSKSLPFDVGIQYLTRDLSAIAPGDYTALSPTPLTLKAGQTSARIIVRVTGDTVAEADETFRVLLARPSRVLIGDGEGVATILDDDAPPPLPPSGKIVYSSYRGDLEEIWVMNADGSNQTQITYTTGVNRSPSLSPDGTQIAWESDGDGFLGIYRMNIDGSGEVALSPASGAAQSPQFSSDGSKIVFSLDADDTGPEDFEIYVMNSDGSDLKRVTDDGIGGPDDYTPCFSPDGLRIAFTTVNNGNTGISLVNLDGSNRLNLDQPSIAVSPHFSPDGTRIAFLSFAPEGGQWQLFTMKPDGSDAIQLTHLDDTLSADTPCFSPDGRSIAFAIGSSSPSQFFDQSQIFTINADGSGQIQRTFEGYNVSPSWSIAAPSPTAPASSSAAPAPSAGNS